MKSKKFSGRVGTPQSYTPAATESSLKGEYLWTTLTTEGYEFSIHKDRESADYWADRIHGSVIPFQAHDKAVSRSFGIAIDTATTLIVD